MVGGDLLNFFKVELQAIAHGFSSISMQDLSNDMSQLTAAANAANRLIKAWVHINPTLADPTVNLGSLGLAAGDEFKAQITGYTAVGPNPPYTDDSYRMNTIKYGGVNYGSLAALGRAAEAAALRASYSIEPSQPPPA